MDRIRTLLIENNSFIRAGVKSHLHQSPYYIERELESIGHLSSLSGTEKPALIIYGVEGDKDYEQNIRLLKQTYSECPVVVLCENKDLYVIQNCFNVGADGLILKNIPAAAFTAYLDLVMMGERIFPTPFVAQEERARAPWGQEIDMKQVTNYRLSNRELDIVQCLANGDPNKMIARRLDITETTVKTHLKAVLRKLGVNNRTQAAILAVSQGLVVREPMPMDKTY